MCALPGQRSPSWAKRHPQKGDGRGSSKLSEGMFSLSVKALPWRHKAARAFKTLHSWLPADHRAKSSCRLLRCLLAIKFQRIYLQQTHSFLLPLVRLHITSTETLDDLLPNFPALSHLPENPQSDLKLKAAQRAWTVLSPPSHQATPRELAEMDSPALPHPHTWHWTWISASLTSSQETLTLLVWNQLSEPLAYEIKCQQDPSRSDGTCPPLWQPPHPACVQPSPSGQSLDCVPSPSCCHGLCSFPKPGPHLL